MLLFASGGLFCVRTDQPQRGSGRAGGKSYRLPLMETWLFFMLAATLKAGTSENTTHSGLGSQTFAKREVFGTNHDKRDADELFWRKACRKICRHVP